MEKLEKITMKTMEFEGPSDKRSKIQLQGVDTPLLTEGGEKKEVPQEEKKMRSGFFSTLGSKVKSFFKLRTSGDENEDGESEETSSSLASSEDEGMTSGNKASERKMPVSFPWRSLNVKNALVVMSLALIAVAGYINVKYYSENGGSISGGNDIISGNISDGNDIPGIVNNNGNDTQVLSDKSTGGDSENASTDAGDDYFSVAVISRQRSRDESIELLMTMLEKDGATEAQKEEITSEMSRIADEIANEVNIENLIKAKGMEECVAVISQGNANIIVRSDGLTPSQVAQIKEIVYLNADIHPKNIKIIEKGN
ncbi:MAG: SpoIIIAH-like family protein [Ruminococcaceae bacterium]|nr:SpoIIIAH-like family protein [Oscillospiraceae bacterium]